MKHSVIGLSVLLSVIIPVGTLWAADEPSVSTEIVDTRDASFLPPPSGLVPLNKSEDTAESTQAHPSSQQIDLQKETTVSDKKGAPLNKANKKPAQANIPPKPDAKGSPEPSVKSALPIEEEKSKDSTSVATVPAPLTPETKNSKELPAKEEVSKKEEEKKPKPSKAAETQKTSDELIEKKKAVSKKSPPTAPVDQIVESGEVESVPAVLTATPEQDRRLHAPAVVAAPLADIDPETMGLLSPTNGGLGAALWKDTSRALVDRLLPTISLPTASPTLNSLARRIFLTTAAVPYLLRGSGQQNIPSRSLLAQRVEALMALGDVSDAWALASLAAPKLIDPLTLRSLAEASIIGPDSQQVCDNISNLMEAHAKTDELAGEWQKSLLVCQLKAGDTKAVQLGMELIREKSAKDAVLFSLISKNVLGKSERLPRQLTPLQPLTLAVLRQLNLSLPSSLYARANAMLIPELLQTKAQKEDARLELAEKAAAKGIITMEQLAKAYQTLSLTPEDIMAANIRKKPTARSRAMSYQAALNEQSPFKKMDLVHKVTDGVEDIALIGKQGELAASILESIPVKGDFNAFSVQAARLFVLAGKPDQALLWIKQAKSTVKNSPQIAQELTQNWPLFALSGLVPDGEYAQGFNFWLNSMLAPRNEDAKETHERRQQAGQILLILNAAGYAVSEEAWLSVIDGNPPTKQLVPSPILVERLEQAANAGRRGEAALLALLMVGTRTKDAPLSVMVAIIKALRQMDLPAEAQAIAREAFLRI